MSPPILELRDLRKTYGNHVAVDGISAALEEGEFLSLLGPSGSGKTSTLAMVAGFVEPSGGEILLRSQPLNPLPPYRLNIGMVFQNYALFPHMTVAKNIAFPLDMHRTSRSEIAERVSRVLALVGLASFGERLPHQLSGGQQQRIALARAIVFEPPLLLMDERLGALDKKLREQMQLEIKQLHRKLGMSIIYVTHDQEEALTMSDRIAALNNGRIEQIGTPTELYEGPATRFVADFIGGINLFCGIATAIDGGPCDVEATGLRLRARHSGALQLGQAVCVAVRLERTRLAKRSAAEAGAENRLIGEVTERIYLGRSRKYVIRTGSAAVIVVQEIQDSSDPVFAAGQSVAVHWSAEDAMALTGI